MPGAGAGAGPGIDCSSEVSHLLFTLFIILIFRLGAQLPTPGVSVKAIKACTDIANNGSQASVYQLVNLFSGGALLKLSVFALGIMPYITASIILQLLTVVIPRLETLKKEGQSGTTKITQYTRYLTIGLAILQSTGIVAMASTGNLFQGCTPPLLYNTNIFTIVTMVVIMTAGTSSSSAWRSSQASSSWSRPSAASRCSTPSAWSAAGCTAAPRRTSRSR